MEYDESVLEFIGFSDYGEIITSSLVGTGGVDAVKQVVAIMFRNPVTLSGKICSLKFRVKDNVQNCIFEITMSATTKNGSTEVESLVIPGLITVRNYIPGDLTGDGNVDVSDVITLLQYSIFPDLYPLDYPGSVDFNGDGNVDVSDVIALLQFSIFPDLYPLAQ